MTHMIPNTRPIHHTFGTYPIVWRKLTSEPTSTITDVEFHVQALKPSAPKITQIGWYRSRTCYWRGGESYGCCGYHTWWDCSFGPLGPISKAKVRNSTTRVPQWLHLSTHYHGVKDSTLKWVKNDGKSNTLRYKNYLETICCTNKISIDLYRSFRRISSTKLSLSLLYENPFTMCEIQYNTNLHV